MFHYAPRVVSTSLAVKISLVGGCLFGLWCFVTCQSVAGKAIEVVIDDELQMFNLI